MQLITTTTTTKPNSYFNPQIIQRKNKYEELCTDFDLKPNIYPALIFSRVKSYDSVSYQHL